MIHTKYKATSLLPYKNPVLQVIVKEIRSGFLGWQIRYSVYCLSEKFIFLNNCPGFSYCHEVFYYNRISVRRI